VDELKLMGVFARRLQKTQDEIDALAPDARKRITEFLHSKFGWFKRDEKE
jgi:hypothetical protein